MTGDGTDVFWAKGCNGKPFQNIRVPSMRNCDHKNCSGMLPVADASVPARMAPYMNGHKDVEIGTVTMTNKAGCKRDGCHRS